jgi:N-acetylglucosamine-6-phosphate deacetylase
VIKIAVDHGVVAAGGHTDAIYDQTRAGTSAGAQTSRPLVSWGWATRSSTGDPADLVMLDSTLTPTAVMIGGIWID